MSAVLPVGAGILRWRRLGGIMEATAFDYNAAGEEVGSDD